MQVVLDIEANGLFNPTKIWLIVCKDIETGEFHIFRSPTDDEAERRRFVEFDKLVAKYIGHNILGYDCDVIRDLLGIDIGPDRVTDTLILSKTIDYPRKGHSIEDYGVEFGIEKGKFSDFSKWSPELETYCIRDVDIAHKVYLKYLRYLSKEEHKSSLTLEHRFQVLVNKLSTNGFSFSSTKASKLLLKVEEELKTLDLEILKAFPPKEVLLREFTPRATKHGSISKTSVPRSLWPNIHEYEVGKVYRHTQLEPFNPSSHKQLIEVLHEAGWSPVDKTQTHIETERELHRLRYSRDNKNPLDLQILSDKLAGLSKSGWKINENNLITLPPSAPAPARSLARRILLEARRRTLTEWLSLVCLEIRLNIENIKTIGGDKITAEGSTTLSKTTDSPSKTIIEWLRTKKLNAEFVKESGHWLWITIIPQAQPVGYSAVAAIAALDGLKEKGITYSVTSERIHGRFMGLGAWTHRMAHQNPNTANIPSEYKEDGSLKLLGKEMRSLWQAPKNRLLVGVDAEGIQLRIFAHYIDDKEFTDALVNGKKADKSDPHSLNQRIIGDICKTRLAAKRFIFALLLGAGSGKLGQILGCTPEETRAALDRILDRYSGFARLKSEIVPRDAKRGWFHGIDGRQILLPGLSERDNRHLCMSGYLQAGEACVMKRAALLWHEQLEKEKIEFKFVNMVHDEWQTECANNMDIAIKIAKIQADSLRLVGEELGLKCPLAGSYYNEDTKDYTIGTNWYATH